MLTEKGQLLIWKSFTTWLRQHIFGCFRHELPIKFSLRIIVGHWILRGMGEESTRLYKEIEDLRRSIHTDTRDQIRQVVREELNSARLTEILDEIRVNITKPQGGVSSYPQESHPPQPQF